MTMKKLVCRYAGVRKNFRIDLVSNSDITAHEFERWSVRPPPPAAATSAPRLGSALPRLHGARDLRAVASCPLQAADGWPARCHACSASFAEAVAGSGTGLAPATSAPGLKSRLWQGA